METAITCKGDNDTGNRDSDHTQSRQWLHKMEKAITCSGMITCSGNIDHMQSDSVVMETAITRKETIHTMETWRQWSQAKETVITQNGESDHLQWKQRPHITKLIFVDKYHDASLHQGYILTETMITHIQAVSSCRQQTHAVFSWRQQSNTNSVLMETAISCKQCPHGDSDLMQIVTSWKQQSHEKCPHGDSDLSQTVSSWRQWSHTNSILKGTSFLKPVLSEREKKSK